MNGAEKTAALIVLKQLRHTLETSDLNNPQHPESVDKALKAFTAMLHDNTILDTVVTYCVVQNFGSMICDVLFQILEDSGTDDDELLFFQWPVHVLKIVAPHCCTSVLPLALHRCLTLNSIQDIIDILLDNDIGFMHGITKLWEWGRADVAYCSMKAALEVGGPCACVVNIRRTKLTNVACRAMVRRGVMSNSFSAGELETLLAELKDDPRALPLSLEDDFLFADALVASANCDAKIEILRILSNGSIGVTPTNYALHTSPMKTENRSCFSVYVFFEIHFHTGCQF
eukprot:PhF_6_TR4922/c0_g1_i1/m.6978